MNKIRIDMKKYMIYRFDLGKLVAIVAAYLIIAIVVAVLFFDCVPACVLSVPFIGVIVKKSFRIMAERKKNHMRLEFKELLFSLAANMAAGYSIERAFVPAYRELEGMYQGHSLILGEISLIIKGMEVNQDIGKLLGDFATRSGVKEIDEFARVVYVSGKSGGNVIKMMKGMAENIDRRMEVEMEVSTTVAAKRFEQNIMTCMPFAMIIYMRVCNPGYMDVMYGNIFGVMVMAICLCAIVVSVVWSRRITDIHV